DLLRDAFKGMRGVKVNYTDVRISAMEDFVGRGDRRLVPVVKRAWELGAGMDAWWENQDKAYGAWAQAIEEAGLTWKYRQVDAGEWNIFDGQERDERLYDAPLPWDHLDTGIEKTWLKEDLFRALAAATVPDCSFEGCSHCGVCGVDFGHNIVAPVPPIPEFDGDFKPNMDRVQRLRVWFGKQGSMALVSHLDLVRLFDRAVRRSALPISYTGGFHPGPRISIANALPLGSSSSGEIVDFDLTESLDPVSFRERLSAVLPPDIPLYRVVDVDPKSPAATQLLTKASYRLELIAEVPVTADQWQGWTTQILASEEMLWEKTTKRGKKVTLNLREQLLTLSVLEVLSEGITVTYTGTCRNDGTQLQPRHLLYLFEQVSGLALQLGTIHREGLLLDDSMN
ncbi:MAG: TIGR03936 family radical SAM-associated protein, partial [Synechocystis sp.]